MKIVDRLSCRFRKGAFYTKDIIREENCTFGDYTYGRPTILQFGEGAKLKVGKFCSIAREVQIMLGGNHRVDWVTTYPFPALTRNWPEAQGIAGHPVTKGDVIVGNDVWIGQGATILSGVVIGDGAVIGAKAVVSSDVEPYAVVAGNPARIIGKRFDDESVRKLLEIRWWDWPDEKIKKHIPVLCSPAVADFFRNVAS
jgi:acetyltransferase-like isoleucine patch superfamily enzyme